MCGGIGCAVPGELRCDARLLPGPGVPGSAWPGDRPGKRIGRARNPDPPRTTAKRQAGSPNSRAISIRCTSLVPSPISRILESRHILATGYSFMKP